MKRSGGWFGRKGPQGPLLRKEDEVAAVREAVQQAAWVMNDEIERAETELAKGTSPFHQLGYGACLFWQAVLGFDKAMMAKASQALADAESTAAEHLRMSHKDPNFSTKSKIYPMGAAYLLCQTECQLLGAILGILKESWMESLQGLNKLRKAYFALQELVAAEKKYLKAHPLPEPLVNGSGPPLQPRASMDSDNDVFVDALEDFEDGAGDLVFDYPTKEDILRHHSRATSITSLTPSSPKSRRARETTQAREIDFRLVSTDETDLFVHSGVCMCWGIIQIVLSVVPPALRHILSMFNFRGERDDGMRLLWQATNFKNNIFGAIAGLVTLLYNNIAVALADIIPQDAYPEERLKILLKGLQEIYPDSQLWRTEESRIAVNNRDLERGLSIINIGVSPHFKQMQGLRIFEKSLDLMFMHRFQECADSFLECITLNRWSHGMYYYIAAICHIEMYRDCKESDPKKASAHAARVKELLEPVPPLVRMKALLGRQLPFDAFIDTKLLKWEARAKARKCDLIDVVGISPVEEMSYFWTGYRRASAKHLQTSLDRLNACEEMPSWADQSTDEKAGLGLLQAVALRCLGKIQEAKTKIHDDVFCYSLQQIKGVQHASTYPLPVAHYEMGVCMWVEFGGEKADHRILRQIAGYVEQAAKWESWDLEDRMVVKIAAAKETMGRMGVKI